MPKKPPESAARPDPLATVAAELLAVEQEEQTVGAYYRLRPEQVDWLADMARRRKTARGGRGRADASEVLRFILDRAMGAPK